MLRIPGDSDRSLQGDVDSPEPHTCAQDAFDPVGIGQCVFNRVIRQYKHEFMRADVPEYVVFVQIDFELMCREIDQLIAGAVTKRRRDGGHPCQPNRNNRDGRFGLPGLIYSAGQLLQHVFPVRQTGQRIVHRLL